MPARRRRRRRHYVTIGGVRFPIKRAPRHAPVLCPQLSKPRVIAARRFASTQRCRRTLRADRRKVWSAKRCCPAPSSIGPSSTASPGSFRTSSLTWVLAMKDGEILACFFFFYCVIFSRFRDIQTFWTWTAEKKFCGPSWKRWRPTNSIPISKTKTRWPLACHQFFWSWVMDLAFKYDFPFVNHNTYLMY